jgi:hypothetical protein
MSGRWGRIQRRIWRAFIANPGAEMRTTELAAWAYPRLTDKPQRKHLWAIRRAAKRAASRVRRDKDGTVFRAKE